MRRIGRVAIPCGAHLEELSKDLISWASSVQDRYIEENRPTHYNEYSKRSGKSPALYIILTPLFRQIAVLPDIVVSANQRISFGMKTILGWLTGRTYPLSSLNKPPITKPRLALPLVANEVSLLCDNQMFANANPILEAVSWAIKLWQSSNIGGEATQAHPSRIWRWRLVIS
jgi:hypothetical protein